MDIYIYFKAQVKNFHNYCYFLIATIKKLIFTKEKTNIGFNTIGHNDIVPVVSNDTKIDAVIETSFFVMPVISYLQFSKH